MDVGIREEEKEEKVRSGGGVGVSSIGNLIRQYGGS